MSMFDYDSQSDIQIETYGIGGKMLTGSVMISDEQMEHLDSVKGGRDAIRYKLVSTLVEAMIENKLVEITQEEMSNPYGITRMIRARAYVCPDSMTKLLRVLKKEGKI